MRRLVVVQKVKATARLSIVADNDPPIRDVFAGGIDWDRSPRCKAVYLVKIRPTHGIALLEDNRL